MLSALYTPLISVLCVGIIVLLWLPCLLRAVRRRFRLPKDMRVGKIERRLQKRHALLGKALPVLVAAHAITSFSQLDINVVLGLGCLALSVELPARSRRRKEWLARHEFKARLMAALVLVHVLVQLG